MMRIDHIALWTQDIEQMRRFYMKYFQLTSNEKYVNLHRGFTSYFLSAREGARIELMHIDALQPLADRDSRLGLAHLAFSVGSKKAVDNLTEQLRNDGYTVLSEPRITGTDVMRAPLPIRKGIGWKLQNKPTRPTLPTTFLKGMAWEQAENARQPSVNPVFRRNLFTCRHILSTVC